MAKVTGLFIYPVKSCGIISIAESECSRSGFRYDREWGIVGEDGKAITQRVYPQMTQIQPTLIDDGDLRLEIAGNGAVAPLLVSKNGTKAPRDIDVWGAVTTGWDEGDDAAEWLSGYLGVSVRLVRKNFQNERLTQLPLPNGEYSEIAFVDSMPILVAGEESLAELNGRLEVPVPMDRFRPSIVVTGLAPYAEDTAKVLRVGSSVMHNAKPCARCVIVTIDQLTGEKKGPEPLKELAKYRRIDGTEKVAFGQYFLPESTAVIKVGDTVSCD